MDVYAAASRRVYVSALTRERMRAGLRISPKSVFLLVSQEKEYKIKTHQSRGSRLPVIFDCAENLQSCQYNNLEPNYFAPPLSPTTKKAEREKKERKDKAKTYQDKQTTQHHEPSHPQALDSQSTSPLRDHSESTDAISSPLAPRQSTYANPCDIQTTNCDQRHHLAEPQRGRESNHARV